ncbi:MAG: sulfatase-like hydrolase/transferase [Hungatella sp.]|nr:sulfatase-like hydrolase/transferase [Hungatella sp.]
MSKEILFIISDQHAYKVQGNAGNTLVGNPNLDRLAAAGTVMRNSYAACPLCVPSRLSMLTGQFPSRLKALTNDASLDSEIPTFVHSLNAGGYETTLCGRMHFVGPDQRHGFIKRLVGDITPTTYGRRQKKIDTEALPWNRGRIEHLAIRCMGGGDSTVLAFDRDVTDAAVAYLGEDHQAPQFLCVGLYAPHFPYIAPKELFDVEADPWETQNRFTESPEIVSMLSHAVAAKMKDPRLVLAELEARRANMEILSQCRQDPKEEWQAAAGAAQDPPVPMVASKIRVSFL